MATTAPASSTSNTALQPFQIGRWRIDIVSGGLFRIDGGAMFGVVPKTVWQHVAPADESNRILVSTHCLLARDGTNTVLVDTGYGGKYSPLERKVSALEPGEPIVDSLARVGVAPDQVTHVVFSHLHFDHAGGATRWDAQRRVVPTFPRAQYLVQKWEWEDASSNASEVCAAYTQANFVPLAQAGLLSTIEGDVELLPGLNTRLTGGHTRGHQALMFDGGQESLLYIGDVCITSAHIRGQWATAYDTFLMQTRLIKPKLLAGAVERGTWVVWNHDPWTPVSRVARDAKGEFVIVDPVTMT